MAGKLDVVGDCVGGCGGVELDVFVVGVVDLVGEGVVELGDGTVSLVRGVAAKNVRYGTGRG